MIFDAHTHIGSQRGSVDEQIAELRQAGISGAMFAPFQGVLAKTEDELNSGNQEALDLYEEYPDFLYPGVVVHPEFPESSMRWLREFRDRHLIWSGENLSYVCQIPFNDKRWTPFFDFCAAENMVFQMHNAPEVAEVAARYPQMTFIGSHLNPEVLPLLVEHKNVMVDISGLHGGLCRGTLQNALAMFGPDRLLFGTDFPGYDAEPFVIRVKRDILEKDQKCLFSENLLQLFRARNVKKIFGTKISDKTCKTKGKQWQEKK